MSSSLIVRRQARKFWCSSTARNNRVNIKSVGRCLSPSINYCKERKTASLPLQCWNHPSFSTTTSDDNDLQRNSKVGTSDDTAKITNTKTTIIDAQQSNNNIQISHLAELSKARLSALVVSTTAFGFVAAGPTALALHHYQHLQLHQ